MRLPPRRGFHFQREQTRNRFLTLVPGLYEAMLNSPRLFPYFLGNFRTLAQVLWRKILNLFGEMVLQERIELSTSPLPRECSTTELLQRLSPGVPDVAGD